MFNLSNFKKWAEEQNCELIKREKQLPGYGSINATTETYFRAVFDRFDHPSGLDDGSIGFRAKEFVEVNEYGDKFSIRAGSHLLVTEEEWQDPGEQDYQKEEVNSAGQMGGEVEISNFDGLRFREVGSDGYVRQITVEVVGE